MGRIKENYIKFFMYLVVIILINVAGVTLFFRLDLTANKIFSLSDASHEVVSTLSEPLTIKVFFTKNLPAPHNNTERYLHDLLEEYAAAGGREFNYRFYDVTASEAGLTDEADHNRQLAKDYGIAPVQIRVIENDEVKFQQAYMGLVIIHGDLIEKIPAVTSTDGLEYKLTTAIQKLNNKVSALGALETHVGITLYLSSSLEAVAPLMGLNRLSDLPHDISAVVERLNAKSLGKIDYRYVDPTKEGGLTELSKKYNLMVLQWPAIPQKKIEAGSGTAGLVLTFRDKVKSLPVITSVNLPIIGTTYQMSDPASMEDILNDAMETMIGINQDIGYLADHGTPALASRGMMQRGQSGLNVFNQLLSKRYSVKRISLKEGGIPGGLQCLIIARPTEPFSDYELFQLDQALMSGTNLALFLDPFKEEMPAQGGYGMGPTYKPLNTGLERLLKHYGVTVKPAYVLDSECYKQILSQGRGEQPIYFAPMIKGANIDNTQPYMKNIKGVVAMQISPLELSRDVIEKNKIQAVKLLSSSDKAWEMKGNINLNPMFITPPKDSKKLSSFALSYMLSGSFPSYFAGRDLPRKETGEKDIKPDEKSEEKPDAKGAEELSMIKADNRFIEKGEPGKIFILGCSQMLQDNMLDAQGRTTNATFILNVLDHLNGRDEIAAMRSKIQTLNPLGETSPMARGVIKGFNIVALPVLVILLGFGVWGVRGARKRKIKAMFDISKED